MNAPVPLKVTIPSLAMSEEELITVLGSSLYPGAKVESMKLVIGYCKAAGLDPLQKPVHIVPMNVKIAATGNYEWRDIVMPGIELYRVKASRDGGHIGTSEPTFGPDKVLKIDQFELTYPEWCKVTVSRLVEGREVEFTAVERWTENYATAGKDTKSPNAMWKKRPYGQLAKCAEAQALRKAFPELGAQPTAEEMEGKVIDVDPVPERPQIEDPRSKSAPRPQAPAATPASSGHPSGTGDGAAQGQPAADVRPLNPSQVRVLRVKLERAGLSEVDLGVAFPGKSLEPKDGCKQFLFGDFNAVQTWISENAKG